jgi:hypothetical protein
MILAIDQGTTGTCLIVDVPSWIANGERGSETLTNRVEPEAAAAAMCDA